MALADSCREPSTSRGGRYFTHPDSPGTCARMVPAATSGGSPLIRVTVPASVFTKAPSGPTPTMDLSNGCRALFPVPGEEYNSLRMAMSVGPSTGSSLSRLDTDLPVFVDAYNSSAAATTSRSTS